MGIVATVQIGIDLGQKHDPTGICVAELDRRESEVHYLVRHLERIPLETGYPDQVERIVEVHQGIRRLGHRAKVYLDATGLGQPVLDILHKRRIPLVGVFLTGSERAVWEDDGRVLRLGKSQMVSRLQVLLSYERIHLPQTPEAAAMVDELLNYEIRVNANANAQFGAFKTGKHDDLATALGLACWNEPERRVHYKGKPAFFVGVSQRPVSGWQPMYEQLGHVRDRFAERGGQSSDQWPGKFSGAIDEILGKRRS